MRSISACIAIYYRESNKIANQLATGYLQFTLMTTRRPSPQMGKAACGVAVGCMADRDYRSAFGLL